MKGGGQPAHSGPRVARTFACAGRREPLNVICNAAGFAPELCCTRFRALSFARCVRYVRATAMTARKATG